MLLLILATSISPCLSADTLDVDTPKSREGYFVLSWNLTTLTQNPGLQQSESEDFSSNNINTKIIANEGAITITGLPDGEYYFRLVDGSRPLTEPRRVSVEHHALSRAAFFFLLGFVLFLILVFSIFHGARLEGNDYGG